MAEQKMRRDGGRGRDSGRSESQYDQKIIDLARVTRVMKGGKRMRFRCMIALGDHNGKVGVGVAKGADVSIAIGKAVAKAEKAMITVPMSNGTLPHAVEVKFKAAKILLKPAPAGSGLIAGGPVRTMLELAGVANASTKIMGSSNKINNVYAVLHAFSMLRPAGRGAGVATVATGAPAPTAKKRVTAFVGEQAGTPGPKNRSGRGTKDAGPKSQAPKTAKSAS